MSENYKDAVQEELEARSAQKKSKYQDDEIKNIIFRALSCRESETEKVVALTQIAQAMIAYNNMIDRRWE